MEWQIEGSFRVTIKAGITNAMDECSRLTRKDAYVRN